MFESAINIVAIWVKEAYITNMLTIKAYKSSNRVPGVSELVLFFLMNENINCAKFR